MALLPAVAAESVILQTLLGLTTVLVMIMLMFAVTLITQYSS